jgi:hypothetical protein
MSKLSEASLLKLFVYLDRLRASGRTNMWGAAYFLEQERGVKKERAVRVLGLWMKTFDENTTASDRVKLALALPEKKGGDF